MHARLSGLHNSQDEGRVSARVRVTAPVRLAATREVTDMEEAAGAHIGSAFAFVVIVADFFASTLFSQHWVTPPRLELTTLTV